jgi:spore coat protein U-like protein
VALSSGSGSYAAREMSSGTNVLRYNLYTTAARTVVWGDTTSGTGIVTGSITFGAGQKDLSVIHPVHGRIPGNQSPAPGNYATAVPITVTVVY